MKWRLSSVPLQCGCNVGKWTQSIVEAFCCHYCQQIICFIKLICSNRHELFNNRREICGRIWEKRRRLLTAAPVRSWGKGYQLQCRNDAAGFISTFWTRVMQGYNMTYINNYVFHILCEYCFLNIKQRSRRVTWHWRLKKNKNMKKSQTSLLRNCEQTVSYSGSDMRQSMFIVTHTGAGGQTPIPLEHCQPVAHKLSFYVIYLVWFITILRVTSTAESINVVSNKIGFNIIIHFCDIILTIGANNYYKLIV